MCVHDDRVRGEGRNGNTVEGDGSRIDRARVPSPTRVVSFPPATACRARPSHAALSIARAIVPLRPLHFRAFPPRPIRTPHARGGCRGAVYIYIYIYIQCVHRASDGVGRDPRNRVYNISPLPSVYTIYMYDGGRVCGKGTHRRTVPRRRRGRGIRGGRDPNE